MSRRAVQGVADVTQDSAARFEEAGRAGSETARGTGAATTDTMRHLGDIAGETVSGNTRRMAGAQNRMMQDSVGSFEETIGRIARFTQDSARDWRTLMQLPGAAGVQDVAATLNNAVERVMHVNLHAMQELFRMAGPPAVAELQQRFVRGYLDALLQGSAAMARAIRQSAEQTLEPLEEHLSHGQSRQAGQRAERVADVMEREVRLASPEDNVQQVARMMRDSDVGLFPVSEGDRLVGMVTDRDVTIRLVAEGRDPARTKVRDVMSSEVRYVYEDEDLEHVAENMAEQQVRRLPVMNRQKRLVGVVSLADIAQGKQSHLAARHCAALPAGADSTARPPPSSTG